ncbi:hypothetical protein [Neptuniibacter sp.]|uniref:hypothetical protein n=1 Tax=Neptuniibacter sp. TaxID=1962643 RepID=UPI00260CF4AE|nr:hypothetical protein [Neptuniibacter sp.]MCP4595225.1 Rrf2 family transcriptional regulator [Neptuniibacter sp.]
MADNRSPLSTSALAKALGKTTKQMFSELETLGWIKRVDESWLLTTKGEFEGGKYRESQKFGRYIIWPVSVTEHKVFSNPDGQLLTSSQLAKSFSLPRKMMDQVLQELGWVNAGRKGWILTALGQAEGGCQRENSSTAVPYVLWPESIPKHPALKCAVDERTCLSEPFRCCDGHSVSCEQEQKIDNWLYFSGLLHAYQRRIPLQGDFFADFYLPQHHLYIEYWGEGNQPSQLAAKMRKKELLELSGLSVIELNDQDIDNLGEVLPRLLLKYGIET